MASEAQVKRAEILAEATSLVSATMFNFNLAVIEGKTEVPEFLPEAGHVGLTINLAGQPHMHLAVICTSSCGKKMATKVFQTASEEVDPSMVCDVLGELLNVVAGQLKTLMGVENEIGLPKTMDRAIRAAERAGQTWDCAWMTNKEEGATFWLGIAEHAQDCDESAAGGKKKV